MVSVELVFLSRMPWALLRQHFCVPEYFSHAAAPCSSVTEDLKPIFFASDSFSWQAETYLSSGVFACLFLILI